VVGCCTVELICLVSFKPRLLNIDEDVDLKYYYVIY